jgi:predicted Fe-S protein YdhL (DUF1289 family)
MGEEAKPKVAARKKQWQRQPRPIQTKAAEFKAPTSGLEDKVFKVGDAKDAADFADVKKAIGRYCGVNFKSGGNMAQQAIEKLVEPTIEDPKDPPSGDKKAELIWQFDLEEALKKKKAWKDAKERAYQLVLSHCHPLLEEKLEACNDWERINADQDLIQLLKLIRAVVHKHDDQEHSTMALVEHDMKLYMSFQKDNESDSDFYKAFNMRCDVVDTFGGQSGYHQAVYMAHCKKRAEELKVSMSSLSNDEKLKCRASACDEYKACLFIKTANGKRYNGLKVKLQNLNLFNHGAYPKTVEEAYRMLQKYEPEVGATQNRTRQQEYEDSLAFGQVARDLKDWSQVQCHGCGEKGHGVRRCPKMNDEEKKAILEALATGKPPQAGQSHVSVGNMELQECLEGVANVAISLEDGSIDEEGSIATADGAEDEDVFGVGFIQPGSTEAEPGRVNCGRNKLFLDSACTQHTMFAVEYLTKRGTSKHYLKQNCNAGYKLTNRQGYWCGLQFWENEEGIANLLSMPQLEKSGWKLDYTDGVWKAYSPNGKVVTFKRDTGMCAGMPYLDMNNLHEHVTKHGPQDSLVCVETVRGQMEGFTAEQVKRATEARDAVAMMAHPPVEKLKRLVSTTNVIKNIPFDVPDLTNGEILFGRDRGAIRGKTVRKKTSRVRPVLVSLPRELFEHIRNVTLAADVMFCNLSPYLEILS